MDAMGWSVWVRAGTEAEKNRGWGETGPRQAEGGISSATSRRENQGGAGRAASGVGGRAEGGRPCWTRWSQDGLCPLLPR